MTEMDTHDRINLTGPWAGFGFQGGHMFTPEGYSLEPVDMTWWSLTCNIAREWRLAYPMPFSVPELLPSIAQPSHGRTANAGGAQSLGFRAAHRGKLNQLCRWNRQSLPPCRVLDVVALNAIAQNAEAWIRKLIALHRCSTKIERLLSLGLVFWRRLRA